MAKKKDDAAPQPEEAVFGYIEPVEINFEMASCKAT